MPEKTSFWNAKAKTFPRFTPGENNYEAKMLRLAREHGVDFKGKHVLDLGCGSGMYTIRIAQEAARVTALDISEEMLRILMEDAQAQGVTNITPVQASWDDFVAEERFDVIFASMTPAIHDDSSREKLVHYGQEKIAYMGFADYMISDVMAELYQKYEIAPQIFNDVRMMREWLEERDIAYTAAPAQGEWVVPKPWDDFLHATMTTLKNHGLEPDLDHLHAHLQSFRDQSGSYIERTNYSVELVIW